MALAALEFILIQSVYAAQVGRIGAGLFKCLVGFFEIFDAVIGDVVINIVVLPKITTFLIGDQSVDDGQYSLQRLLVEVVVGGFGKAPQPSRKSKRSERNF